MAQGSVLKDLHNYGLCWRARLRLHRYKVLMALGSRVPAAVVAVPAYTVCMLAHVQ